MPASAEVDRIQSYLRESARGRYQSVPVPPFTLFIFPDDPLKYFNYAIPDRPTVGDLARPLGELRAVFRARQRTPRFEFFEAFAPDLPAALRDNGFMEEARQWSMLCPAEALRETPAVPGLEVIALNESSPDADIHDFLLAQRQGFDPSDTSEIDQQAVDQARRDLQRGWHGFLGRLEGQPAGVSGFGQIIGGVTEIGGVATREAFRRRGIAAYLTWAAAHAAIDFGAQTLCLTAEDAAAGRVYERAGFRPFSIMLAYIDAAA